jgi:ribA/ribD-fused uncharacterized protein
VHFQGLVYPTSEHLFQAHKFLGGHPTLAERIRTCTTAREARELAEANMAFIRPDWAAIRITVMDDVLAHKFAQHPDLAQLLKWTGRRELRQLHELRKNSPVSRPCHYDSSQLLTIVLRGTRFGALAKTAKVGTS